MFYEYFVSFITEGGLVSWASVISEPITDGDVLERITSYLSTRMDEGVVVTSWRRWEEEE